MSPRIISPCDRTSGNPSSLEKAQIVVSAAVPKRQKVSSVMPEAAIKQPNGLMACNEPLGDTSGFISSCSMATHMPFQPGNCNEPLNLLTVGVAAAPIL